MCEGCSGFQATSASVTSHLLFTDYFGLRSRVVPTRNGRHGLYEAQGIRRVSGNTLRKYERTDGPAAGVYGGGGGSTGPCRVRERKLDMEPG